MEKFFEAKTTVMGIVSSLLGLALIDQLDIIIRIISAIVAVAVGIAAFIHYISKTRLNNIETKIKEQELYDIIKSNKKKHG